MNAVTITNVSSGLVLAGVFLAMLAICVAYVWSGPQVKAPSRPLRCRLGFHRLGPGRRGPTALADQDVRWPFVWRDCLDCPHVESRLRPQSRG